MTTYATAHPRRTSLAWSAACRAAELLILGLIGYAWLFSAGGSAWRAVSLAAVSALAATVGITWYLSHARAERRWRAAWDRHAELAQAKGTESSDGFGAMTMSDDQFGE